MYPICVFYPLVSEVILATFDATKLGSITELFKFCTL